MGQDFHQKNLDDIIDIDREKMQKTIKKVVPGALLLLLAAFLFINSFYTLENKENAVVLRFGRFSTVVREAGPHFKVPFIDRVEKVDVESIYTMEYGYRTAREGSTTADPVYQERPEEANVIVDAANNNASIAIISLLIQYKIEDPVDYLFKVDDVEGTLRLALEDVVRNSVQAFTLDEAKTKKELIDLSIQPALQQKMYDYQSGIEIAYVRTQNVEFLPNVEAAYQAKENANQYKNSKTEEAQKYKNTVIPAAEAQAAKLKEEALGYKASVVADARAGIANYNALYTEYLANPGILKERFYIDAMTKLIRNNKIIVDLSGDGQLYKFYNLDDNQLVKQQLTAE